MNAGRRPKLLQQFERQGYVVVPDVLSISLRTELMRGLPASVGSGTRRLLEQPRYQQLARSVRSAPSLNFALEGLVCVQAILFQKTTEHNWSLQMHTDSVFPIKGEGTWASAGDKEGCPFVQVPREVTSRFVAVRLCLDDACEGDLKVEPGSHWPNPQTVGNSVVVTVPRGGALVLNPSIRHGSSKLETSTSRRVIHLVYAPPTLPESYSWVRAV